MNRLCKHCGSPFEAERSYHVYCSKPCRSQYANAKWRRNHPFPFEYEVWHSMRKRCNTPSCVDYTWYCLAYLTIGGAIEATAPFGILVAAGLLAWCTVRLIHD